MANLGARLRSSMVVPFVGLEFAINRDIFETLVKAKLERLKKASEQEPVVSLDEVRAGRRRLMPEFEEDPKQVLRENQLYQEQCLERDRFRFQTILDYMQYLPLQITISLADLESLNGEMTESLF